MWRPGRWYWRDRASWWRRRKHAVRPPC
ncbi:hypothetical protein ACFFGY_02200 [Roseomonas elaeocarpi]|uniref:Uncharacterized protein n=1 Tax=Roseomonas elaeocarpi TaxID=907779 RepID=A0ABV6JMX1_9PROT